MVLRIGLIGCGGIMEGHVEGWKAVRDRAEIVAVSDVVRANAERRIAQAGVSGIPIYEDYHDLLADKSIDAVDIALPHHLHRDSIVAAAEAGKHILSEKPFCRTLAEADDIAAAVKKSGVRMMAAHNQIFFPAVLQARQMIMNGDLGKIYLINSADCYAHRAPLDLNKANWAKPVVRENTTWRGDPEKMGGGELIDTGYHPIYRLLFLAGQEPVEVSAVLGTYRLPLKREDTAHLLCKFADGMVGRVYTSWGSQPFFGRNTLFNIIGEAGQLWGEIEKLWYLPINFQTPAEVEFKGWDYDRSFKAEIQHFCDAIEGGYEPLSSVAEGTAALRVIMAAYRSAEQGIVASPVPGLG